MRLTLGLGEFILLNAGLDSLVELRVKDTLSSDVDLVVSLDILLDSLATITRRYSVSGLFYDQDREHLGRRSQRHQRRGEKKTGNIPATISFFQLCAERPVSNENQ